MQVSAQAKQTTEKRSVTVLDEFMISASRVNSSSSSSIFRNVHLNVKRERKCEGDCLSYTNILILSQSQLHGEVSMCEVYILPTYKPEAELILIMTSNTSVAQNSQTFVHML